MAVTLPDEFDNSVGQLSGYTTIRGGFASYVDHAGAQQDFSPTLTDETDSLNLMLGHKHVDIRSMITVDPDHGRPQNQVDLLHQMENAYHQSLNLVSGTASAGYFTLAWQDTGPTIQYVLTTDYVIVRTPTTCTIARSGGSTIPSGTAVWIGYVTSVGEYERESHTLTGTTPVAFTHQADGVVEASIRVTSPTETIVSGHLAFNITPSDLQAAIEDATTGFSPQARRSLGYAPTRPAVLVTSNATSAPFWPYIVTFQDETQPPDVREIGSWVPELVIDNHLTGSTPVVSVTNLRTDLNFLQNADTDDSLTQEEVETVAGSTQEAWEGIDASTGVSDQTVGKDADYFNWRSQKITFDGDPVNIDLISATPLTPVNIEQVNANHAQNFISFVVPEWTTGAYESAPKLDLTECSIQFTSADDGIVTGTGPFDSDEVFFDGNMDTTFFQAALTAFGTDCDWTRVTGVRIHLESTGGDDPDADDVLTFMALRASDNHWEPFSLDENTRTGHIESPVTMDASPLEEPTSPLIRSANANGATSADASENSSADPTLTDGAVNVKFNSGKQVNLVQDDLPNMIVCYLRETTEGANSTWIQGQVSWGKINGTTGLQLSISRGSNNGTATTLAGIVWDNFAGLENETDYLFTADVEDDVFTLSVATIDSEGQTVVVESLETEDTDMTRIRGRAGWWAYFQIDKDVELDYFRSANVSFATLITSVFHTHTPVDGGQLFVSSSDPTQEWSSFELTNEATGADTDDQLISDTLKSLSGSSYRFTGGGANTYSGIQSNIIDFDDWTNLSLDFDVWMPATLSAHNNVQQLTIEASGSLSGTFKLTHDGAETGTIPYNATAAQVQHALELLGTIGVGNVLCTQGPLPAAIVIKFIDGLAGADVSTLVVSNDSVVNGTPVVTQVGVRPQIFLKKPLTEGDYTIGTLGPFTVPFIPGTWSHVHLDLSFLSNVATNPYRVQILTQQPSTQTWWVDNMKVLRRSVSWEMRALADGDWFPFHDQINNPKGALHLPPSARGRAVQLRARALAEDSWISNYTLLPHYATPGRLIASGTRDSAPVTMHGVVSGPDVYTPA